MKLSEMKDIDIRHILTKWKDATIFYMAARGRKILGFQVNLTRDNSLERYWVGNQKLSLEQVWKVNV